MWTTAVNEQFNHPAVQSNQTFKPTIKDLMEQLEFSGLKMTKTTLSTTRSDMYLVSTETWDGAQETPLWLHIIPYNY